MKPKFGSQIRNFKLNFYTFIKFCVRDRGIAHVKNFLDSNFTYSFTKIPIVLFLYFNSYTILLYIKNAKIS